jgi:hypothetical protein
MVGDLFPRRKIKIKGEIVMKQENLDIMRKIEELVDKLDLDDDYNAQSDLTYVINDGLIGYKGLNLSPNDSKVIFTISWLSYNLGE